MSQQANQPSGSGQAGHAPLVTVGLPVYNGENYLRQAIDSVLAQTFDDFELLISDNASTDSTEAIAREYAARDSRVKYLRNPENIGAARNYNRLVHDAKGEYFRWISHDDTMAPSFLATTVEIMRSNPDVGAVVPALDIVDADGELIERTGATTDTLWEADRLQRHRRMMQLLRYPDRRVATFEYALHRRSKLLQTGMVGTYITSDNVFCQQLALTGRLYELATPLGTFRVHDDPGSSGVHYRNGDWASVQLLLDPTKRSALAVAISQRRRYVEFFLTPWKMHVGTMEAVRMLPDCALPLRARVGQYLERLPLHPRRKAARS